MTWLIDLDGVVWLAGTAIPGAAAAVERLGDAGEKVVFLTNNSGPTVAQYRDLLAGAGLPAAGAELVTSAQAAASMLEPGTRAAVVGGEGILEALGDRGVEVVAAADGPEAVVVGRSETLDYGELAAASTAIRAGARFVATNTDATFPTGNGVLPGAGAVIAFLATASGRRPEVAGKPHQPAADLLRARYGGVDVVVGDRPDTDGAFARRVGARFMLVLSGVTSAHDLPVDPAPDEVADDLATLVRNHFPSE
ncbi:MAG TPA: HAD-IIA family hydrolase [Acidimicrobiales bacterium]|nr:HAD-IIA family hydrolase [Acidimicrobiales bacterium]